ncbi:uncharacterized protein LOC111808859 isoform X1 [Cucurbita pepo subsp. pepo]|uniref:uncharacterized protein LOC111808859 isoform X1 n=1 Tax=Cucurbita pepo subsp. pepo TaxID=3664 RepID=UPI000C9D63DB|nr:uncharacterized protein LOC111808859 isoform X1 [Cucurbita pepo subsp. pepo]
METLELRPPQFSEDLAWLPCWLQHNQATPSSEQEIECNYESAIKESEHSIINNLEDANLYPRDGGSNDFRLFLSGQDSIPESVAISSNNQALHFHLHLSSYGGSECTPTQDLDGSHELLECNKVQSTNIFEASLDPRVNISFQKGINAGDANLSPHSNNRDIVDNVVCKSVTNTEDNVNRWREKSDVGCLKNAEVNNAIELSVVASEALVIHDLLKAELDSEAVSVESVLEVSIRVKQTRVELLESAYESLNEEVDLSDSLSDLDDLLMRDAFDDVGFPCSILSSDRCETICSDVQDTPVNENQFTHGSQCNSIDMPSQPNISGNGLSLQQSEENLVVPRPEGMLSQHLSCNIHNQLPDHDVLGSASPNYCKYGSMSQQSGQNESDEFVVNQKTVSSAVNTNLCMNHAEESSNLHECNTVSAKNDEQAAFLTPDRFKSRWLGGWSGKEEDVSEQLRQNVDGKTIPSMFVNETSFLSESADIAPDENSCVQRCESKFLVASQSSVPFGHLDENGDEGSLVAEDVVKCSLSLVDPLCSFVPCSISLDTDCTGQNLNEGKDCTKECLGTFVDIGGSRPSIRKQLTSLKTYSTILPTHGTLEGGLDNDYSHHLQGNMRLLSSDSRLDCTIISCKRNSMETLPSQSTKSRNTEIVEESQTDTDHNLVEEIAELKSISDEVAGDGSEFLVQSVKKRKTRDILSQGLQVSKSIMKKSRLKKDHLQSSGTETISDPQKVENTMKMQYESKNTLEPYMLMQKRVRFLEANDQPQENSKLQKVHPSKNYSTLRTGKKWKLSNQCVVSSHRDGKGHLKSPYCRSGKKLIFQGIQFLVTGFSSRKEKDIDALLWNNGGIVLPDIPCPSSRRKKMSKSNCKGPPVILSSKKLQTTKFLYGCAVNALIVNVSWLTDSIAAGSMLPPWKYMIISNQADCTQIGRSVRHGSRRYIFENVGVMLHGKQGFCTKLTKVLMHGGGQVFKTLQWLLKSLNREKISVGVIVVEDEYKASRHLKQCASEQGIPLMSTKWVIKSLHLGELLPFTNNNRPSSVQSTKTANIPAFRETSVEL